MSEKVIMPKELTAENGAKKLLIGEFFETLVVECPECDDGVVDDEVCEECEGAGEYSYKIPVTWPTIKEIYRKAVEHLGENHD